MHVASRFKIVVLIVEKTFAFVSFFKDVDRENQTELNRLTTPAFRFTAQDSSKQPHFEKMLSVRKLRFVCICLFVCFCFVLFSCIQICF